MLQKIEFFNSPDGTINMKRHGLPVEEFNEGNREEIEEILIKIKNLYPMAFKALTELYAKSERNKSYFDFLRVSRFIRCNFGEFDSLSDDIDAEGMFNFEQVKCPLRGECKFEGVICLPSLKTSLTERENEVVRLLVQGYERETIAEELGISPYTVTRHLSIIRARLGLKSSSQIIAHFKNVVQS